MIAFFGGVSIFSLEILTRIALEIQQIFYNMFELE